MVAPVARTVQSILRPALGRSKETNMRECGCLGGNENCSLCYGLGYVATADDLDRIEPTRPPSRRKPKRGPNSESLCSTGRPWQIPQFRRTEFQLTKAPTPSGTGCPYCPSRFDSFEKQDLHVEEEHTADEHDHSDDALCRPLVRKGGRVFERITRCRLPRLMNNAFDSAHNGLHEKGLEIASGPLLGKHDPDTDSDHNENENYREGRRLDGSRDYWQLREEGRFGSHPSYDDCEDDSAP